MTPTKVFLVSYGGGHIPMALALMQALRRLKPGIHIDLLALTTAYAVATRAGEKAWRYADLQHLADPEFSADWGAKLAPAASHPSVSDEETRAYYGVNFWDLVQQHGLEPATELYGRKGRQAFLPLNFFRRLINHFNPDVVVATVSPRSEEAALQAAIGLGVPTLSMTDLFLRSFDPYCHRPVYADRVTVINNVVKETLNASGVPAGALRVTGNPAFDGLKSPLLKERAAAFRSQMGWVDKTVVLWAGHADYVASESGDRPSLKYPVAVEARLRHWVDEAPDRALIIRYHPNEAHLFPVGADHPCVFISTPEQHVHDAVMAADVVVVQRSTVGLEAALAGKPVVALVNSPLCIRDDFNYEKLGIGYAVPLIDDLPRQIAKALVNGCAAPELAALGPAAPQVAELVLDLAVPHIL